MCTIVVFLPNYLIFIYRFGMAAQFTVLPSFLDSSCKSQRAKSQEVCLTGLSVLLSVLLMAYPSQTTAQCSFSSISSFVSLGCWQDVGFQANKGSVAVRRRINGGLNPSSVQCGQVYKSGPAIKMSPVCHKPARLSKPMLYILPKVRMLLLCQRILLLSNRLLI